MSHPEPTHPRERLLFLGSGVLLLLMVVVGLAREQRWGAHFIHVYLEANNTNGLHSGEEVRISGVPVGQVGGLKLMPDAKVRVQLKVEHSKAQLIGPASTARLGQEGLVGERFIEISADPQATAQTIDGTTIPFRSPISLESTLEELSRTQRALQATLNNTTTLTGKDGAINTTLADLRKTLQSTQTLSTTINQEAEATAPVLRDSLNTVSREVREVSEGTQAAEREAQQLLKDTRPLITGTLQEVRELAQTSRRLLNTLLGVMGPLLEPADPTNSEPADAMGQNSLGFE